MSSGLPRETLGQIWALANRTTPGKLTKEELYAVLAMIAVTQVWITLEISMFWFGRFTCSLTSTSSFMISVTQARNWNWECNVPFWCCLCSSAFAEGNPCSESRRVKPVSRCPRSYVKWISNAAACRSEPAASAAPCTARLHASEHRAGRDGDEHHGSSGRSCSTAFRRLPPILPTQPGQLTLLRGKSALSWKGN